MRAVRTTMDNNTGSAHVNKLRLTQYYPFSRITIGLVNLTLIIYVIKNLS